MIRESSVIVVTQLLSLAAGLMTAIFIFRRFNGPAYVPWPDPARVSRGSSELE